MLSWMEGKRGKTLKNGRLSEVQVAKKALLRKSHRAK